MDEVVTSQYYKYTSNSDYSNSNDKGDCDRYVEIVTVTSAGAFAYTDLPKDELKHKIYMFPRHIPFM